MKNTLLFSLLFAVGFIQLNAQTNIVSSIESGNAKQVVNWINDGHDINTPILSDKTNMSLLSYAALQGKAEIVDILLKKGANPKTKIEGKDALMFAAKSGNKEVVNLLLQAGADYMAESSEGYTARDFARMAGNSEVEILLATEMQNYIASFKKSKAKAKKQ